MISDDVDISLGLDVGKTDLWACALNESDKRPWSRALPNEQPKLIAFYRQLQSHGTVLVIVDQPATIGALAVAVAQKLGIHVDYLPGLTMRRIADMYLGYAKNR